MEFHLHGARRGYPHAHIVYRGVSLDGSQPMIVEEVDRLVQARFPAKDPKTGEYQPEDEKYVALIEKHMMHKCSEKCRPRGWRQLRCKDGYRCPVCEKSRIGVRGCYEYCRLTEDDARIGESPHERAGPKPARRLAGWNLAVRETRRWEA